VGLASLDRRLLETAAKDGTLLAGRSTKEADLPAQGQIVRVRARQYLVEEVVPPHAKDDSTWVKLACLDDDAQGQPLEVLWEKELDAAVMQGENWQRLAERGFDPPHLFAAFLHTLRWNCVTATDPRLFQSPFRAGIRIDAYQLEPLRKALLLPRVNLFIADDVGLGKTVEAGLIARELLLRKKVSDIVVSCPPSMISQWREELENRFGLLFEVLDKAYIARVRQQRGFGVNPWTTHTRFLISHRLLIDEDYAGSLRDWLGELRSGSLLILDEAHHAAPSSGARYAIDSKITRAIRDLAPRFEHRLFLSATPHNGHSNSFSALLEILDPQRFCRGVPVRGKKLLEDVMVRRLKEDVREVVGGFPRRIVEQIDIDGLPDDAPELRLSSLLDEYRRLREQEMKAETKKRQAAAALVITHLQQRLLSSVEAFARTLRVHRRTLEKRRQQAEVAVGQLDLLRGGVGSDDDRAEMSEADLLAEEEAQVEAATLAFAARKGVEQVLDSMTDIAEAARGLPDARMRYLIEWIRKNMCPDEWNRTRLLIFTEYDDTRRYIHEQIVSAFCAPERIAVYFGATAQDDREQIKRAFNADPSAHPLRILISTDAGREGLNLQAQCWNLFHFDIPWNPSRLEQRNGRIDRKLQPHPDVVCRYFVHKQRPEDHVLQVLIRKTEVIKRELGSLSPVVETRLSEILRGGIRRREIQSLKTALERVDLDATRKEAVTTEMEEARVRQKDLVEQINVLRGRLEESKKWIGLEEEQFRSAISCALGLAGADPLKPAGGRYLFPALDRRDGADPTWADTMDALRAPGPKDQNKWEWRRASPIRPVVFEDPGTMDESVVHLHLEHRVVQRLLGRFRAQGFVHNDLSRACLAQTADPTPRVLLLGRLCLYGPRAARLHEEIIPVTARWVEPEVRKKGLVPYKREAETRTLEILEDALGHEKRGLEPTILKKLQAAAPRDIAELLPHLEERGVALAEEAGRQLGDRGDREAAAMRSILEDQKRRVASTAEKYQDPQLYLDFNDEETRQLESNKRHWQKRLAAIDRELDAEPERIRAVYSVHARRIEPVGLVYLWPASG
jgi:superfamily II DNA or RNA helicase